MYKLSFQDSAGKMTEHNKTHLSMALFLNIMSSLEAVCNAVSDTLLKILLFRSFHMFQKV